MPSRGHGPAAHVLVVDDTLHSRDLAGVLLEELGCRVETVSSGEAALRAVQETAYDLVLMDEQMPGMSGIAATRLIRVLDHPARDTPIIACSASASPHHARLFEAAGMNGYVAKPPTRADLARVLVRHTVSLRSNATVIEARGAVAATTSNHGRSLFSADRLDTALGELRSDLTALAGMAALTDDVGSLARATHTLSSTACILDFPDLGQACQIFEAACERACDPAAALAQLLAAARCALGRIDGMQSVPHSLEASPPPVIPVLQVTH